MEWIESAIKLAQYTNKYTARHTISVPAGNGQAGTAPDSKETIRVRVPIGAIFTRVTPASGVGIIAVVLATARYYRSVLPPWSGTTALGAGISRVLPPWVYRPLSALT